ncbi:MAG: hypothetical protein LBM93_15020, partial [Oscillospiraceae bacterium]|nr:hypothetical protein [Oscillospiraceae bacterium]
MIKCPFCKFKIKEFEDHIDCASCGKYTIDNPSKEISEEDRTNFAGYLFETNRTSTHIKKIVLENDVFKNEVYSSGKVPKTTAQKMNKLLANLYKLCKEPAKDFYYESQKGISIAEEHGAEYNSDNESCIGFQVCYTNSFRELQQIMMLCNESEYFYIFKDHNKRANDALFGSNPLIMEFRFTAKWVLYA